LKIGPCANPCDTYPGLKTAGARRVAGSREDARHLVVYARVTVYSPQAVNSIRTVAVRPPRTTTATNVPASNRGASAHPAL
jgi:hypothetical protein